jgi:hypothetical protein
MRGQEHIVTLRRKGAAPAVVFLSDCQPLFAGDVQYTADDKPRRADLRFLIGLTVSVTGSDAETVKAWASACREAGAKRVIWASERQTGAGEYLRCHLTEINDSAGFLTWQA